MRMSNIKQALNSVIWVTMIRLKVKNRFYVSVSVIVFSWFLSLTLFNAGNMNTAIFDVQYRKF